ncbi:MAG: PAS domain S-box protein [Leptospirillia bacterium]
MGKDGDTVSVPVGRTPHVSAVRRYVLLLALLLVGLGTTSTIPLFVHHAHTSTGYRSAEDFHDQSVILLADLEVALERLGMEAMEGPLTPEKLTAHLKTVRAVWGQLETLRVRYDARGVFTEASRELQRGIAEFERRVNVPGPTVVSTHALEQAVSDLQHRHVVEDMATIHVLEANDKRFVRIFLVMNAVCVLAGSAVALLLFRNLSRTLRRQAETEHALRESEQAHAEAQATAHLGHWDWRVTTNKVTWSDECYRIFGRTPEQLGDTYEGFLASLHEDDRERTATAVMDSIRSGEPYRCDYRVVYPDGETLCYVQAQGEATLDPETGNPLRLMGTVLDVTERHHAEERLLASERRFRTLVENAADGILLHDGKGRFLDVNRRACEALGYSRDELLSMGVEDIEVEVRGEVLADLWERLRAKEHARIEGVHRRKDGSTFPVEVSLGLMYEGTEERVVAQARDITERRQAEAALRASEARFRSIFDDSHVAIGLGDMDSRIVDMNPAYEAFLGYSREELIGKKRFEDFTHPDDLPAFQQFMEQFRAGKEGTLERRYIRKDGTVVWGRLSLGVIRDADGKPLYGVGMVEDITERKRAVEALEDSEERLSFLLNEGPAVFYTCSGEEGFPATFVGDNMQELFGYSEADFLSSPTFWVDHIHPDDRERVLDDLKHLLESGKHEHEYRFLMKDGGYRWISDQLNLIRDAEGNPDELVGFWVDITERKKAEEELARYQAELAHVTRLSTLGEMASGLAHEINQPLAAISNFAHGSIERIEKGNIAADGMRQSLGEIASQAERAGDIVRHMRSMVRKGTGVHVPLNVNTLVEEAVRLLHPEIRSRNINLKLELEDHLSQVQADRIQLDQVLINLLRNAFDAVEEGDDPREVTVRTAMDGKNRVEVSVADNGIGLSPEVADKLFHPFFTTKPEGLGMGLSISRSIIEAHEGELSALPNRAQGAILRFVLPARAKE